MDNLGAHKVDRVVELIEGAECRVLFLPPYSPDFSPIEPMWSKVKQLLRTAAARTCQLSLQMPPAIIESNATSVLMRCLPHCPHSVQLCREFPTAGDHFIVAATAVLSEAVSCEGESSSGSAVLRRPFCFE